MTRFMLLAVLVLSFWPFAAARAERPSRCIAYAGRTPDIVPANFTPARLEAAEVEIEYAAHSTFRLTTPAGVIIATDYDDYAGEGPVPHVVTMNHAHNSHYTDFPDPAIRHVLRGWNPQGGAAEHHLVVGDTLVRNVTTDIRSYGEFVEKDGNSIFIFEVADLCIGHLGHLHHKPTPKQFAQIGRLDVVFAAVDGGMTLDLPTMIEVMKGLRASLVIPMHYFDGSSLQVFLAGMSDDFVIRINDSATTKVSITSLPRRPTVLVLPGY